MLASICKGRVFLESQCIFKGSYSKDNETLALFNNFDNLIGGNVFYALLNIFLWPTLFTGSSFTLVLLISHLWLWITFLNSGVIRIFSMQKKKHLDRDLVQSDCGNLS